MHVDPRLALLIIALVVGAILLIGNAHSFGTSGAGMPGPTDCGLRNPAGHRRGCPEPTEGD